MADYDPATRRALFAETFKDVEPEFNGRTPLDMRRRRSQILTEAKEAAEARDAALFEQQQRADPRLMQAVTGRRRENRMLQEGFERSDLARQRFEFDQGKEQRATQVARKKLELDMGREERLNQKLQMEMDIANRKEEDELGFDADEQKLRESVTPGSTAYQRGIFDILLRRKNLDRDFRNNVLKAAGVIDPEEAWRQAADAVDAGASRATAKLPGGGTATFVSPKDEKPLKPNTSRLDTLRTKIAKVFEQKEEDRDKDYLNYLQGEFEKERSKGAAPTQGAAPTPAQAAPQSFEAAAAAVVPGGTFTWGGKTWRKPQAK